jgi:hypothetical protein
VIIYRVTAAVALILEISEMCNLHLIPNGPYGGSALAQLGALFGVAFVTTELREGLCQLIRGATRLLVDLRCSMRRLLSELKQPPSEVEGGKGKSAGTRSRSR